MWPPDTGTRGALSKDDPAYLHSRSVVCNWVIYGKITGDCDADGNGVQVVDQPIISYFKRSASSPLLTSSTR